MMVGFDALVDDAIKVGGEITSEERMTGESNVLPVMQVVGATAKDALYYDEAREENISRAGQFRFLKDGEVVGYFKKLEGIVIIENRVGQTGFYNNEVICRGISSNGLFGPVCTSREGMVAPGVSCQKCPLFKFNKATTHPISGEPMQAKDYCKAGLELFAIDLSGAINDGEPFRIAFTSMAIGAWRAFLKPLENKGAKLWAYRCDLSTTFVPGQGDKSGHYEAKVVPHQAAPILQPDEFKTVEEARAALIETLKPPVAAAAPAALPVVDAPASLPAGIPEDPFGGQ